MTSATEHPLWSSKSFRLAFVFVSSITLIRIALLFLSPFNLGPDEAQYWDWSRNFAFGYFSKPPMIAWLIGLETWACGSSEACIRIGSPLLHMGTSLVMFVVARDIFDDKVALWSALGFATLPSVSFSAGIVSTDVLLLFFWTCALGALYRLLDTKETKWALLLGIALGFGFLSKYAMIYFLLGSMLFLSMSPTDRWLLTNKLIALPLLILGVFLTPNLLWNMQNDFSTVSHTAANANWGVELFNLESLGDFFSDQFGIFGPILFIAFLYLAWRSIASLVREGALERRTLYLICFSLPIVTIVLVQSFISRANANWAVTTYIAATILVTAFLLEGQKRRWLFTSFGLHIALTTFLYTLSINTQLIADAGLTNAFKRVRGWDVIGTEVQQLAEKHSSDIILTDNRLVLTELLYYATPTNATFRIWDADQIPENHYELTMPLTAPEEGKVLLAARSAIPKSILANFEERRYLRTLTVPVGKGKERTLYLYELRGYHGRRN
jgi:4-amino-4-deoxy-L-arabinose transferase-like glycosyltransferase